jgi:hypothetical protein
MMALQPVTGASQQQLDSDPSALCTEGLHPFNLMGYMLWVLRRHFSDADWIRDPVLKDKLWVPEPDDTRVDANESKILIEPVTKAYGQIEQIMQQRPALLIKRNRFVPRKIALGDREQGHAFAVTRGQTTDDYELDTAVRYHVIILGSYTVFGIGNTGGEAESVATEAFFELLEFGQLIRRDAKLNEFRINDMGTVNKLEESEEHFVVPIVLTLSFFHNWKLRPEMPLYLRRATQ